MEKKTTKKEYIYYRESALQSFLGDAATFGFLGLMLVANHFYLNDSKVAAVVIFIVFIIFTVGKANSKAKIFTNLTDLKKYINSL